jgi:hypothetical protein
MMLGFMVGFVFVLCVGNYYRALRASERQKERRLAKMMNNGGLTSIDSPKSSTTSGSDLETERQHLLAPRPSQATQSSNRRRNNNLNVETAETDLLLG